MNKAKQQSTISCLCLPSHYGDRCQFQSDRVSLTIRFRTPSNAWQTLFLIIVSLVDDGDERTIHSYEQLTYLSFANCKTKYNIDLLYSTRAKNQSKVHFVHIDIYEKKSLTYRGSLFVAFPFPFLPVQRLATELTIPHSDFHFDDCLDYQCVHGHCTQYFNAPKKPHILPV